MDFNLVFQEAVGILQVLALEDFLLLALIIVFVFDRKCDHNFMLVLVIIFIVGLPNNLLASVFGRHVR